MKKFLVTMCALLVCPPALAYLDPGTGSMLLQVLLGGVAAIGVALKLYWHRFTSFFQRGKSATGNDPGE